MQLEHQCPVCGSALEVQLPVTFVPERGMVIANDRFAVLTTQEMHLVQRLVEVFPRVLTKEAALDWLYQLDPDGEAEIKIVDVLICKARKKLTGLGVRIDTIWGKGYALALTERPRIVGKADA